MGLLLFRLQAIALFKTGKTEREISRSLGISKTCVHNAIQRYKEKGTVMYHKKSPGPPKKLTERDMRQLVRLTKNNRTSSSSDLAVQLKEITGKEISAGHIRRVLCSLNLRRRPAPKKHS